MSKQLESFCEGGHDGWKLQFPSKIAAKFFHVMFSPAPYKKGPSYGCDSSRAESLPHNTLQCAGQEYLPVGTIRDTAEQQSRFHLSKGLRCHHHVSAVVSRVHIPAESLQ